MGKRRRNRIRRGVAAQQPFDTSTTNEGDIKQGNVGMDEDTYLQRPSTKGRTLQRHKLEYRAVRFQVRKLRQESLKYNKKTIDGKRKKKEILAKIKSLHSEMEERHRQELSQFEHDEPPEPEAPSSHVRKVRRRKRRRARQKEWERSEDEDEGGNSDIKELSKQLENIALPDHVDVTSMKFNF